MVRYNDYFLCTKIYDMMDLEYEDGGLLADIKVDYDAEFKIDVNIIIPKYLTVLAETELIILILKEVRPIDMECMQLNYIEGYCYKLNKQGKEYYNLLCMMMSNKEADDTWITDIKFIRQYCLC